MTPSSDFLNLPQGAVAVVTGAASGIGRETCRLLLAQGITVLGLDINADGLASLEFGEGFHAHVVDTGDAVAVRALLPTLRETHGPIGYLVNNAGPPSSANLSIEQGLAQTAGSVQNMTQAWAALDLPDHAAVVNVSSVAGNFSGGPPPAMLAGRVTPDMNGWYSAGKAAIGGVTRFHAVFALGRYRSNAVAPGVIATPRMGDLTDGPYGKMMIERSPLGRLGQATDVANAIVFLLSPAAGFINGVTLTVDGGGTLVY